MDRSNALVERLAGIENHPVGQIANLPYTINRLDTLVNSQYNPPRTAA